MTARRYDFDTEISALGSHISSLYLKEHGSSGFPIDPEIIATKYFGLDIMPVPQLHSGVGVRSGLDTTQSVLFIDERIYMNDDTQYLARQSIAHELGHIVYDANRMRAFASATTREAYEVHVAMRSEYLIEGRANDFAGALLVPRRELLIQASKLLKAGLEGIQQSNPNMTMEMLVTALSASKLSRYFGVSDDVIRWRLKNERFFTLIGVRPETILQDVDIEEVYSLCCTEADKITPSITERIMGLIPQELAAQLRSAA